MSARYDLVESPVGTLLLLSERGALSGLYLEDHRRGPALDPAWERDPTDPVLRDARRQLAEYFAGERTEFSLPLALRGTPFQRAVWSALQRIPFGETRTYGELAAALGRPGAARAVGLANARNPVSIVVPCHRVVGSGGALTGYAGGLARKRALLDLEAGRASLATV